MWPKIGSNAKSRSSKRRRNGTGGLKIPSFPLFEYLQKLLPWSTSWQSLSASSSLVKSETGNLVIDVCSLWCPFSSPNNNANTPTAGSFSILRKSSFKQRQWITNIDLLVRKSFETFLQSSYRLLEQISWTDSASVAYLIIESICTRETTKSTGASEHLIHVRKGESKQQSLLFSFFSRRGLFDQHKASDWPQEGFFCCWWSYWHRNDHHHAEQLLFQIDVSQIWWYGTMAGKPPMNLVNRINYLLTYERPIIIYDD